jgi:hypothetical protein
MRRLTKNMGARPSLMTTSPSRAAFYGLPSAVHEQPDAENTLPDTDNRLLDAAPRASSGAMNTEHGSHRRSNAWTQVHSYFALMGGFVFLSDVAQPTKLGPEQKRLTLTPSAIRTIARDASMLLPDISAEEIIDKSKASPFTKFLVCTQATWYVAQTVSRLATGIPISLLEMNTVVHAFCCLLVYTAWWYKSLDVEYPHVINITNEFARKVSAWILVNGRLHIPFVANRDGPDSSHVPQSDFELRLLYEKDSLRFDWTFSEHRETRYGKGPDQHAQHLATLQHLADLREQNQAHGRPEHLDAYGCEAQRIPRQSIDTPECIKIYPGQKIHGFSFQHHPHPQSLDADVYAKITLPFIERLRLADSLRREEGSIWSIVPSKNMLTHGSNIVSLDAPNWNSKSFRHNDQWYIKSQSAQPYYFLLGILSGSAVYGGLHLLAWNGPFPTKTQRLLWRTSCLLISAPFGIGLVLAWPAFCLGRWFMGPDFVHRTSRSMREAPTELKALIYGLPGIIIAILALIFTAARVYLIVACFINIAYLPAAVFQEPSWSKYIPHFGAG